MSVEMQSYAASQRSDADEIVVALVNNMPDKALEATETQFFTLLQAAAGELPVRLRFAYLPEVVRSSSAMERLERLYSPIDELVQGRVDALIVTGTEPKAAQLSAEPYWQRLQALLAWADQNTASSIWSCLAAHAAVEHLDGVRRRRLEHKLCGVYEHTCDGDHFLLDGVVTPLCTPHSRWNDLPRDALRAAGYSIVSGSSETGANMFVKQNRSVLVFFQGHPEYTENTLLKEYRRDVERFMRGCQPDYPTLPCGYFTAEEIAGLAEFRQRALSTTQATSLSEFPIDMMVTRRPMGWRDSAITIFANWLSFVAAHA